MSKVSRFQLSQMMKALVSSGVVAPLTNLQAGRLGINAGKQVGYWYSRQYIDYTRRIGKSGGFVVPGTTTPVALDVNGNPTATYEFTLTSNPLTNDLGVYNCWMPGQCTAVAKSSGTTTTSVTFSSPVYTSGDNITRWTMTINSGGGSLGVKITNPSAGAGYPRIIPATINGVNITEAQSNDFHPDSITQMSVGSVIRGLDWMVLNTAETDWAGSTAAGGDGTIQAKSQSLAEFVRYCNACSAAPWVNIPPLATDAYISTFMGVADTTNSSKYVYVEPGGDEPWNYRLGPGFDLLTQAACAVAGTFAGATSTFPSAANTITSCSRTGNVATAVITGAPRNGNGSHVYVAGITGITGGYVTLTAVVNNGNGTYSISWAETGADVTGTVNAAAHTYASYIHTDVEPAAVHYLVKASANYGSQAANTYTTPTAMKGRYVVERARVAWTAAQSLAGKNRFRIVINNQLGAGSGNGLSEHEVYSYATDRWGDHSWIYSVVSAPYFSSDTATQAATSTAAVLTALEHTGSLCLDTVQAAVIKEGNAAASWGHAKAFYEGGPSTEFIGSTGAGPYIGAAHRDPYMGTMITRLLTIARDCGQTGPFCYYTGGSSAGFGTANETCWSLHENGVINDLTTPKAAALVAWGSASSQAAPIDGVTSGTISIPAVYYAYYGTSQNTNNCLIVNTGWAAADCGIQVTKTVAGNYPLSVYVCGANASDYVSIFVNGVEVAHQIPVTAQNPLTAAPSTPCWSSASYPMNAGQNVVLIRLQKTGRLGVIGLYQVVSPDTPV